VPKDSVRQTPAPSSRRGRRPATAGRGRGPRARRRGPGRRGAACLAGGAVREVTAPSRWLASTARMCYALQAVGSENGALEARGRGPAMTPGYPTVY